MWKLSVITISKASSGTANAIGYNPVILNNITKVHS